MMVDGAISFTARETTVELLPPAFVAVMVQLVSAETTVGVPLMVPVDVSKERPVGSTIDQLTTVPPPGRCCRGHGRALRQRKRTVAGDPDGGASFTTMVTVVVSLLPVLLAVTV